MALRAGRLSNEERLTILIELGEIAREKYNKNLFFGAGSYNLGILKDSLQYAPNTEEFENYYWVDAGSERLNEISNFFEYGTGLFNTKRKGKSRPIKSKSGKVMKFKSSKTGKMVFAKQVKGVKPVFMFTKTMRTMEFDRQYLQRQIRVKLGI